MINWGMRLGGLEVDEVKLSIIYIIFHFILQAVSEKVGSYPYLSRGTETQQYLEWNIEGIN